MAVTRVAIAKCILIRCPTGCSGERERLGDGHFVPAMRMPAPAQSAKVKPITEFGVPCVGIMQHTRETTPPAALERNRTISGMLLLMVGQFRTADGLVPPSGRTLGPQMSCRSPTIQHSHLAHGVISDTKNRYRADVSGLVSGVAHKH